MTVLYMNKKTGKYHKIRPIDSELPNYIITMPNAQGMYIETWKCDDGSKCAVGYYPLEYISEVFHNDKKKHAEKMRKTTFVNLIGLQVPLKEFTKILNENTVEE